MLNLTGCMTRRLHADATALSGLPLDVDSSLRRPSQVDQVGAPERLLDRREMEKAVGGQHHWARRIGMASFNYSKSIVSLRAINSQV